MSRIADAVAQIETFARKQTASPYSGGGSENDAIRKAAWISIRNSSEP